MDDVTTRLAAVEALRAMRLPVGPVEQMVLESVPPPPRPAGSAGGLLTAQCGSSMTLI
jgi:hypothetical protein